jgi:hypothetical protein
MAPPALGAWPTVWLPPPPPLLLSLLLPLLLPRLMCAHSPCSWMAAQPRATRTTTPGANRSAGVPSRCAICTWERPHHQLISFSKSS